MDNLTVDMVVEVIMGLSTEKQDALWDELEKRGIIKIAEALKKMDHRKCDISHPLKRSNKSSDGYKIRAGYCTRSDPLFRIYVQPSPNWGYR